MSLGFISYVSDTRFFFCLLLAKAMAINVLGKTRSRGACSGTALDIPNHGFRKLLKAKEALKTF